jgi:hypothetical protein
VPFELLLRFVLSLARLAHKSTIATAQMGSTSEVNREKQYAPAKVPLKVIIVGLVYHLLDGKSEKRLRVSFSQGGNWGAGRSALVGEARP